MAEAPPNGLFWEWADEAAGVAELEDQALVAEVSAPGPAGSSSIELPSGEVVEVDHLDPARIVAVEVPGPDPSASPLLVGLFGGDGAMRLADEARRRGSVGPEAVPDAAEASSGGVGPRAGRSLDLGAQRAGRLVVLADLVSDPAVHPLARVVAAGEFVASLDRTPGGDLFAPLVEGLAVRAAAAAALVEDADLAGVNAKVAVRLGSAIRPLVGAASGADAAALERLIERLVGQDPFAGLPVAAVAAAAADLELMVAEAASLRAPAMEPTVERVAPSVLEVTVPGAPEGRWVRVLHRDGLVVLATAPLRSEGGSSTAELLVPPGLRDDEVEIQVVDAHRLAAGGAPADVVRRAVRIGRAAASAERAGDRRSAMRRWRVCSELWEQIGDRERAAQARRRGTSRGGRVMVEPLLADELDPYGSELELEGVDW